MKSKKDIIISSIKGIKLDDAGQKIKKYKGSSCCEVIGGSSSPSVRYPSLYVSSKEVPSLKGKDIKNKITLVAIGKVVSHSLNERNSYGKQESNEDFSIELEKVGVE